MTVAPTYSSRSSDSVPAAQSRTHYRKGESDYGRMVSSGATYPGVLVSAQSITAQAFAGSEAVLLEQLSIHPVSEATEAATDNAMHERRADDHELFATSINPVHYEGFDVPEIKSLSGPPLAKSVPVALNILDHSAEIVGLLKRTDLYGSEVAAEEITRKQSQGAVLPHSQEIGALPAENSEGLIEAHSIRGRFSSSSENVENSLHKNATGLHQFARPYFPERQKIEFSKSSEDKEVVDTMASDSFTKLDARFLQDIEFVIYSGSGDATLLGNAKANTLAGGTGDDTLQGGAGDDVLIGGAGRDVFVFGLNDGHDQIIDFSGDDRIQLKGMHVTSEISLTDDSRGQQIHFGKTIIELVGVHGLDLDSDWLFLSR